MSDIFKEVDEDIRHEQYRKIWDRFGPYVILLAVLIVVATAGYRGWEYWKQRQAQSSGDRFVAALDLSEAGKHDQAIAALEDIEKTGSGDYPVLARFRIAGEKAEAGDKAGAVAEFDTIAADKGATTEVRTLARLRSALLLADTASVADLDTRIGDLASTGNPWRQMARELLGLAAWRASDYTTAQKYFEAIVNDQGSDQDVRQRSQLMLALIASQLGTPAPAAPASDVTVTPAPDATAAAPAAGDPAPAPQQ